MLAVDEAGIDAKPALIVHDELVYFIKEDECGKVIPQIISVLEDAPFGFTVPLKVKVKTGKNFGELEEWSWGPNG